MSIFKNISKLFNKNKIKKPIVIKKKEQPKDKGCIEVILK